MLAATTVPLLIGTSHPAQARQGAERVATALRFARDESLRTAQPHGVTLSTGTDADTLKAVQSADILAIAAVILHWTVILTLALGCAIVVVMKGHAYVADAYPLVEKDFPPD